MTQPFDTHTPTPFSHNRVDTPFISQPDIVTLQKVPFETLIRALDELHSDASRQSTGVALIGDPGCGKTHILMRLATQRLEKNRILFVRQPNSSSGVLFHIYKRVLDSLFERLHSGFTQLELMLASTLSTIVIEKISNSKNPTPTAQKMLQMLIDDKMNVIEILQNPAIKGILEKTAMRWWEERYGIVGLELLHTLLQFCHIKDPSKRESMRLKLLSLETGDDGSDTSLAHVKEAAALDALVFIGRLSKVDAPLVLVFDQLEGLAYRTELASMFTEALKEIFTHVPNMLIVCTMFYERWEWFSHYFDSSVTQRIGQRVAMVAKPTKDELIAIVRLRLTQTGLSEEFFTPKEMSQITRSSTVRECLSRALGYFEHKSYGVPLPKAVKSFEDRVIEELALIKSEIRALQNAFNRPQKPNLAASFAVKAHFMRRADEFALWRQNDIADEDEELGRIEDIYAFLARQFSMGLSTTTLRNAQKVMPQNKIFESTQACVCIAFLYRDKKSFTIRLANFLDALSEVKSMLIYLVVLQPSEPRSDEAIRMLSTFKQKVGHRLVEIDEESRYEIFTADSFVKRVQDVEIEVPEYDAAVGLHEYLHSRWALSAFDKLRFGSL